MDFLLRIVTIIFVYISLGALVILSYLHTKSYIVMYLLGAITIFTAEKVIRLIYKVYEKWGI